MAASSGVAAGGAIDDAFEDDFDVDGAGVKVEPTYKTKPDEDKQFMPSVAREICKEVVSKVLDGKTWQGDEETVWTREITQEIRRRVKGEMDLPRYKVVVQVALGEVRSQSVRVASRCLWDAEVDNYSSYSWHNVSAPSFRGLA